MPRRSTGSVVYDTRRKIPVYALRFRAYGNREYVKLGSRAEGWTHEKAEVELRHILADVERGIWQPRQRQHVEDAPAAEQLVDPTFHVFASQWFAEQADDWAPNTRVDYQWQISNHLLPFFARHRLSEITVAEVDRYRSGKVKESRRRQEAMKTAREKTNLVELRVELEHARAMPGISPTSINKTIMRLGQILDTALERGMIAQNPVRVNPRKRKVKQSKPAPVWLDRAAQIRALLDAAAELDARARSDGRHIPRRAIVATLTFAGLRLGELLALRWRDVDLSEGRLTIRAAKTDAGLRQVEIAPVLRDELVTWKLAAHHTANDDLVFSTRADKQHIQNNIRKRILAPAVALANRQLEESGEVPLPDGLTPHKLRHTAISMWFAAGYELPRVMALAGHKHPSVTLSIYAHVMLADEKARTELRELMGVDVVTDRVAIRAAAPTSPHSLIQ